MRTLALSFVVIGLQIALGGLAPTLGAEQLPIRKAGLWQLTTVSDSVGMKTFETCISFADPLVNGMGDKKCNVSRTQRIGYELYVDVVCRTDLGSQTTSTVFTGDFTTWYHAMSKITFEPPQGGFDHMGVTIDGKFLSSGCDPKSSSHNRSQ